MENSYKQKLIDFYSSQKRMPTYSEMASLFGFKSKNAVARVVAKMIDIGIVAKDKLGKLIPTELFDGTPLLGSVKAGFPSYAEEVTDSLNLDQYLIKNKSNTYILEVDGNSMIEAHIEDGDMVIVEKVNKAKDGDIVIAQIDGEFTMKYLRSKGGKSYLQPANKDFKDMYPKNSLEICAIVRGVVRKY